MEKVFSVIMMLLMSASVFAQEFVVEGTATGLPDGTKLIIEPLSHSSQQPLDTATVVGGKFTFSGIAELPQCVYLRVTDSYGNYSFMLDKDTTVIDGSAVQKSVSPRDGKPVYSLQLHTVGSQLTDRLREADKRHGEIGTLRAEMYAPYRGVEAEMSALYKKKDSKAIDSLRLTKEYKDMENMEHSFIFKVDSIIDKIVVDNGDSYWGPMLAMKYYNFFTPKQKQLYMRLSDTAKKSSYGKQMKAELFPGGEPGDAIKWFNVKDNNGKVVALKDLVKDCKVFLLDFWASWCVPCRKEIPNIKAQYAAFKDKGFQVVSISIDNSKDAWEKAAEKEGFNWPSFLDTDHSIARAYHVKAIPAMFLVKADGTIIATDMDVRGENLKLRLSELLK